MIFFDMNRCTIKIPLNTICLGNARIVSLWASACQLRPFISIDPYWPIRWYFPCLTKKLESVKPWFDVRSVHSKCHTSVFVSSIMMNLCDCLFLKRGLQNWGLAILVPPPKYLQSFLDCSQLRPVLQIHDSSRYFFATTCFTDMASTLRLGIAWVPNPKVHVGPWDSVVTIQTNC